MASRALTFFFLVWALAACTAREVAHRELRPFVGSFSAWGTEWVLPSVTYWDALQVRQVAAARYPSIRMPDSPTNQGERVRPNPLPYVEVFLVSIPKDSYGGVFSRLTAVVDGVSRRVYTPGEFRKAYPASRFDTEGWSALMEPSGGKCWVATEPWPMGARRVVWTMPIVRAEDTNQGSTIAWTNECRWLRTRVEASSWGGI